MKLKWGMLVVIALGAAAMVGQAAAATNCGANTGVAATGAPNIVGGIQADGAPATGHPRPIQRRRRRRPSW